MNCKFLSNISIGKLKPLLFKIWHRTFKPLHIPHVGKNDECLNFDCSLRHRDILCVRDMTGKEIKEVLWTALDLKCLLKEEHRLVTMFLFLLFFHFKI